MTGKLRAIALPLAMVVALLWPERAAAVDGVIEINQARAAAGGVTATDTAGFPVTIDRGGSYRLTGDLLVAAGTHGIEISAAGADVTLDLNGFSITGNASYDNHNGIHVTAAGRVRIRNGTIQGFHHGIEASAFSASIDSVHASGAYEVGIYAGPLSAVTDCVADGNGPDHYGTGIAVGAGSVVRGCTANAQVTGIAAGPNSLVSGNNATNNHNNGTYGFGVWAQDGCTIVGNVVTNNWTGIRATNGTTVTDNTVRGNPSWGIVFESAADSGYARNVLTNNFVAPNGSQVSGGTPIGTNLCGNTVCP